MSIRILTPGASYYISIDGGDWTTGVAIRINEAQLSSLGFQTAIGLMSAENPRLSILSRVPPPPLVPRPYRYPPAASIVELLPNPPGAA